MPEERFLRTVLQILRKAGFRVTANVGVSGAQLDALAERDDFGARRLYAIECRDRAGGLRPEEAQQILTALSPNLHRDFHEVWVIANKISPSTRQLFNGLKEARAFTLDELQQDLLPPRKNSHAAGRGRKTRVRDGQTSRRQDVINAVAKRLQDMGLYLSKRRLQDTDIVVERTSGGKTELIGIDIALERGEASDSLVINAMEAFRPDKPLSEAWIIAPAFSADSYRLTAHSSFLRLHTFHDLGISANDGRPEGRLRAAKTMAGRAITENYAPLAANILGLQTLIDDRLTLLRAQRPNSQEAIDERDRSISDLAGLRRSLDDLRVAMHRFKSDKKREAEVVKSTSSLRDTIETWWNAGHERILNNAFATGLFVSAVSICSLAGVRGAAVTLIAGALAGGKPLTDSLKGLGKRLFTN